jgi:hypothetical protein
MLVLKGAADLNLPQKLAVAFLAPGFLEMVNSEPNGNCA